MKRLVMAICLTLILSGCTSDRQDEIVQETDDTKELALIPYNISNEYYRTILPYKEGVARGLIMNNVNSRLDIDEMELGLMRVSQEYFNTKDYFFQAGQYLSSELVESWLRRSDPADPNNVGLNPEPGAEEQNLPEQHRQTPRYLAHILEQNYLTKNENGKVEIGGVSIALSLNTMRYYTVPEYGWPREQKLDMATVEQKGKEYAEEIVTRLREMEELKDVPIVVALFKSEPKDSVIPGSFFLETNVDAGDNNIKKWDQIEEEYILFPSDRANSEYYNDSMKMMNSTSDIGDYFSNFVGVVGQGFYKNGQLQELKIDIPIQFFGKSEIVGFTQFVTGKIIDHFPPYIKIEVYISSLNKQESLIVREANEEDPYVHIYR